MRGGAEAAVTTEDLAIIYLVILMATCIFAVGMALGDWNATRSE